MKLMIDIENAYPQPLDESWQAGGDCEGRHKRVSGLAPQKSYCVDL